MRQACLKSLKALKLDYLDLYLIHWPVTGNVGPEVKPSIQETWQVRGRQGGWAPQLQRGQGSRRQGVATPLDPAPSSAPAARPPTCVAWACLAPGAQAMEGLVREGLVKSIGTSNFGAAKLAEILSYAQIPPAVCQVSLMVGGRGGAGSPGGWGAGLLHVCRRRGPAGAAPAQPHERLPAYLPAPAARWRCTPTTATTRCWPSAPSTAST